MLEKALHEFRRRLDRHNHTDAQVAAVSAPQGAAWEGDAGVGQCSGMSHERGWLRRHNPR